MSSEQLAFKLVMDQTFLSKKIENLDTLVNLEELWLGKNKIMKLEVCLDLDFLLYCLELEIKLIE